MDPEARQRRLLGLLKRVTHAESSREPNVRVFETEAEARKAAAKAWFAPRYTAGLVWPPKPRGDRA